MLKTSAWLVAVTWCVACGSSFSGAGGSGGDSSAGKAGDASSGAGNTGDAGDASGGTVAQAGAGTGGASGGAVGVAGGSSAGAGGSVAGAGGSSAGAGGTSGAAAGSGGSAGADCGKLQTDYLAAVEKARVCDKGATDECSTSSSFPSACGCPILVNSKSEYTALAKKAQKAMDDSGCHYVTCGAACLPFTGASCAAQTMGTGTSYVCTGSNAVTMN